MTNTNRFQPGDKVRVKSTALGAPVDLGLNGNVTYTVAHVDDFGRASLQGISTYFHPSHFELIMRAVPTPGVATYSLKDGEGDWWVYETEDDDWHILDSHVTRFGFEEGVFDIIVTFGIDDEPTAPAETYCVKDGEGDWWHSDDAEEGYRLYTLAPTSLTRSIDHVDSRYGIDTAESADTEDDGGEYETEMALAYEEPGNSTGPRLHFEAVPALAVGDRVEYIGGGEVETEGLIGKFGTIAEVGNEPDDINVEWDDSAAERHGVLAENLRKVTDPTPLQPGDWVKVLARVEHIYDNGSVQAQTFQSDGTKNGTRFYAIASAITRTDEVPEWAQETKPEEPTGLGAVVVTAKGETFVRTASDQEFPWTKAGDNYQANAYAWKRAGGLGTSPVIEVLSEGVEVTER